MKLSDGNISLIINGIFTLIGTVVGSGITALSYKLGRVKLFASKVSVTLGNYWGIDGLAHGHHFYINFDLEVFNPTNSKKSLRDFKFCFDKKFNMKDIEVDYYISSTSHTVLSHINIDPGEIKKIRCCSKPYNLKEERKSKPSVWLKYKQGGSLNYTKLRLKEVDN